MMVFASVIYDHIVVFSKPGGVHYVCFLKRGDKVAITEGYEYNDRTWKDKRFVKVVCPNGEVGFCIIDGLTPIKENSK